MDEGLEARLQTGTNASQVQSSTPQSNGAELESADDQGKSAPSKANGVEGFTNAAFTGDGANTMPNEPGMSSKI